MRESIGSPNHHLSNYGREASKLASSPQRQLVGILVELKAGDQGQRARSPAISTTVLGQIDVVPAPGSLMAVKVQANTGAVLRLSLASPCR